MNQQRVLDRFFIALLAIALAVSGAGYWLSAGTLADHDALAMGHVARLVLTGSSLYLDAWDNKAPLAILFYAIPQWIAPHSYLAQQFWGAGWSMAQASLVLVLLRGVPLWQRSAVASLVALWPLARVDFAWASSEDATNLFVLVALLVGYRAIVQGRVRMRDASVSAGAICLAIQCRQVSVLFLVPVVYALIASGDTRVDRRRVVAGLIVGAVLATIPVIGLVAVVGDWHGYFRTVVFGPIGYASRNPTSLHWVASEHVGMLRQSVFSLLPLVAIGLAAIARSRTFLILAFVAATLAVLAPMKPFGHYQQQLLPALAIGVLAILEARARHGNRLAAISATCLIAHALMNGVATGLELRRDDGELARLEGVAGLLETHAQAGDSVFAIGPRSAYIYFRTDLRPVHVIHWDFFLSGDGVELPLARDRVVAEVVATPPDCLVVHDSTLDRLRVHATDAEARDRWLARLATTLTSSGRYDTVAELGDWRILRRTAVPRIGGRSGAPVSEDQE